MLETTETGAEKVAAVKLLLPEVLLLPNGVIIRRRVTLTGGNLTQVRITRILGKPQLGGTAEIPA